MPHYDKATSTAAPPQSNDDEVHGLAGLDPYSNEQPYLVPARPAKTIGLESSDSPAVLAFNSSPKSLTHDLELRARKLYLLGNQNHGGPGEQSSSQDEGEKEAFRRFVLSKFLRTHCINIHIGPNPKAFAYANPGRLQKQAARSHDVRFVSGRIPSDAHEL